MALRIVRAARHVRDGLRGFVRDAPPGRGGVRLVGLVALAAGLVVALGSVLWVTGRTVATVVALGQLQGDLSDFRDALVQGGTPSSLGLQQQLEGGTAVGATAAADPLWRMAEGLPGVGADLRGLRQLSSVLHDLTESARPMAGAADGLGLESLRASRGLDIAPLRKMPGPMRVLDAGVQRASAQADAVDTTGMADPLAQQIVQLRQGLAIAKPISAEVTRVMPVLYGALGGEGRRSYLLMFQNNAEERASGGNPAALVLLEVDKGKVSLGEQLNSSDFPRPFTRPVADYGAEWDRIYGEHVATYVTNTTFTPDFPQTAQMTARMWEQVGGGSVDGVVSFDPVALSYLLAATGPVPVFGDEVVSSANAVDYLLSDIYALHPNPKVQNRLFAQTARRVFDAVVHGRGGVTNYLDQLPRMLDERRFKLWSARPAEESLLFDTPLGNMLPGSNRPQTVVGVYNNDDATSKMSYFMDESVDVSARVCPSKAPRFTVTAAVENTLTPAREKTLPDFVLAHQNLVPVGGDRQWVQLYGPVGSSLVSATIDGRRVVWGTAIRAADNANSDATGVDVHRPAVRGELYGRPVGVVSITVPMRRTVTVSAVFEGGTRPSKDIAVGHTPRVREVPVTIGHETCG